MQSDDTPAGSGRQRHCVACGSTNVTTAIVDDEIEYGSGSSPARLHVAIPVHKCEACETEYTDEAAEDIRHEAVCRHLGVLNPREILAIRKGLGLSRQRFAELTRLGVATLARWESGEVIQNAALDAYLRLLARPENFSLLESGALSDPGQVVMAPETDEKSSTRFPTLAARGEIYAEARRAQQFKLAACW
jgi:putative zinc finger/helix-turn-helix YgiT family protein